MKTSEKFNNVIRKIHEVGVEVENVAKKGNNTFFNSNYTTLNDLLDALREVVKSKNLSITQLPNGEGGLTTVIMDNESNEWISSTMFVPLAGGSDKDAKVATAHKVGSAITYMRRYSLMAIFGLKSEDDDGNQASNLTQKKAPQNASNGKVKPRFDASKMDAYLTAILKVETERGSNIDPMAWSSY